jgi:hypothetical protein
MASNHKLLMWKLSGELRTIFIVLANMLFKKWHEDQSKSFDEFLEAKLALAKTNPDQFLFEFALLSLPYYDNYQNIVTGLLTRGKTAKNFLSEFIIEFLRMLLGYSELFTTMQKPKKVSCIINKNTICIIKYVIYSNMANDIDEKVLISVEGTQMTIDKSVLLNAKINQQITVPQQAQDDEMIIDPTASDIKSELPKKNLMKGQMQTQQQQLQLQN